MKPNLRPLRALMFCIALLVYLTRAEVVGAAQASFDRPLTVLNYNVWNSFNHNKEYARTVEWVKRLDPDIAGWQELVGWDEQKLKDAAPDWGHPFAATLKSGGYNIGLTSKQPIEVVERRTKGYHHGFLHCRTAGIDVIVCHLWPGKRREQIEEAAQIRDRVVELERQGREVLLMGDFNAHAKVDADWLNKQSSLIERRLVGDEKKSPEDRFIKAGKFTFDVMNVIEEAPVVDLVRAKMGQAKGVGVLNHLGSFPTTILPHVQTPELQQGFLERIDFIFATKGLAGECFSSSIRHDAVTNELSDHYPVVAKFGVKKVDVYLLAGQSNMQGIGKLAKLDANRLGEVPEAQYFDGQRFDDFVVGDSKTSTRRGEFGPEVGFAWYFADAELPENSNEIAILKFHASGQPLHHGWDGNRWVGSDHGPGRRNFFPGLSKSDPNQGRHYTSMINRFRKGLDTLRRAGVEYRVAGFVWMQGEQDSKHVVSADEYASSLKRLKQRIEEDLNQGHAIPMVFGQVLPHEPALSRFVERETIRKRMEEADRDSGHSLAIEGCKMVSTDTFPLLPDKVHYNAQGQWQMGWEFAKALLRMQE